MRVDSLANHSHFCSVSCALEREPSVESGSSNPGECTVEFSWFILPEVNLGF